MEFIEVDGERFSVEHAPGDPQQLNFTWLTGPNPGYGFSSGTHMWATPGTAGPQPDALDDGASIARLRRSIRNFLSQINPATGYID